MIVGIPKETKRDEYRVSLLPVGAEELVLRDALGLPLLLRDLHGSDLERQSAASTRGGGVLLGAARERVLIRACHPIPRRHVLSGLPHGIGAVSGFHLRIHETPSETGFEELHITSERGRTLAEHERGTRHALDTPSDEEIPFPGLDAAGGTGDRAESGGAEAVDGFAGDGHRQAGEQERHARDIAVVLAGLVGATHDHVGDRGRVE